MPAMQQQQQEPQSHSHSHSQPQLQSQPLQQSSSQPHRDSQSTTLINNTPNIDVSSASSQPSAAALAAAASSSSPLDDNRVVRSIPPWVVTGDEHSSSSDDEDDDEHHSPSSHLLSSNHHHHHPRLHLPDVSIPASHHYLPSEANASRVPARKWDHLRTAEPALIDQPMNVNQARWAPYMLSGPQPREIEGARVMSDAWMDENMQHLMAPWVPKEESVAEGNKGLWLLSRDRQMATFMRIKRIILKNPYVPLVFRLTVLAFSLAALGLGARVWHQANVVTHSSDYACNKRASTYMAIILDSVAVPYICYITWDEYLSKPLGLRSATAKVSLLLIDLYFIVFYSSNLSLAFDSLNDPRWACFDNPNASLTNCPASNQICNSQKGLSGVLFIALVAWLITFMISVLRVVERLL